MINEYEELLKELDASNYTYEDVAIISNKFQEVIKKLLDKGQVEIATMAELDRQVFHVQKSFSIEEDEDRGTIRGLSWQISCKLDNSENKLHLPNVRNYGQAAFEFFEKRYRESKNIYIKTEYGMMVYFGQKTDYSKHRKFKEQLCEELINLAREYYKNASLANNIQQNVLLQTLILAFNVAVHDKFQEQLKIIIDFMYRIQQNHDVTKGCKNIPIKYANFMCEKFSIFKNYIDFQSIISRNESIFNITAQEHPYFAIDVLKANKRIEQKFGLSSEDTNRHMAETYERIAILRRNDLAYQIYIDKAIALYKQLGDDKKVEELKNFYSEKRGTYPLNITYMPIPNKYFSETQQQIDYMLKACSEQELFNIFSNFPWIDDNFIKESLCNREEGLLDLIPTTIIDDRGNIVKTYSPSESKFWEEYGHFYLFEEIKVVALFKEAFKTRNLSYKSAMEFLENTWLNEPIERNFNGTKILVTPLDTIKPGIKRVFEEFRKALEDSQYECDFVTIIDSLTLKVEGLLRFICEKLGVPTFAPRRSNNNMVIMEKLFEDLIVGIKESQDKPIGFHEYHITLLKYVMSEKIGWNLRNEVAHSLMKIDDYTESKLVVLFCIILKLSLYKFRK